MENGQQGEGFLQDFTKCALIGNRQVIDVRVLALYRACASAQVRECATTRAEYEQVGACACERVDDTFARAHASAYQCAYVCA
eukprot:6209901-Pleurochrysis_carterae.AAC.1